ncbi:rhomboid family intramembrane serine protease [Flavobacterium sp. WW92]|uniref:rhomboid family protein n=1 Tax=unclassified Flavobacterium TaxID=196869 RepID=UPI0022258734|nr:MULTISPECIES: rhomboid family intramembrane serine protease [unclassified Flavobacterium]WDO12989.1 rhomboid family intramembrane serine protease [Flavobacterium sp. WW92]
MGIIDDLKMQYKTGGITQQLIFWNIGIAIPLFLLYSFSSDTYLSIMSWLQLTSDPSEFIVKPWTILTYGFLHVGILHLLFNMIMLNFAGRLFLTFFTQKQFLGVYILGAIFAGLVFIGSFFLFNVKAPIIGASGAIMAVLIGSVTYAPLYQIRLLLIGTVKLWHIAFVFLILDLIQLPTDNMGGHIAHLGGALFGFAYIKILQNGTDLSLIVTKIIDFFANLFKPRKGTPFKKVHRNVSQPKPKTASKIVVKDKTQQQIDEILDKISQSGYDSLTKEEKEFLFKAGK